MRSTKTIACTIPNELAELIDVKAKNLNISRSMLISLVMKQNIAREGLECLQVEKGIQKVK